MGKRRWLALSLLPLLIPQFDLTAAETVRSIPKGTVLFLCPHGGAKSVIAASYFNRLAEELELPWSAVAAAADDPYDSVPAPVAAFLADEGFDVLSFKPRRVETSDVKMATRVVSIDCDLGCVTVPGVSIERWDDVPKVSVDLEASAAAIRLHVSTMLAELSERH